MARRGCTLNHPAQEIIGFVRLGEAKLPKRRCARSFYEQVRGLKTVRCTQKPSALDPLSAAHNQNDVDHTVLKGIVRVEFGRRSELTRTLAVVALLPALCVAADTFETEIQPILRAKCSACHNSSSHTSGFSIASQETVLAGGARHGVAVSAGKPQESVLIQILKGDIKPQMPLGKSLSAEEIGKISAWISGLKPELTKSDQKPYWAFTKPVKLSVPEVKGTIRNEIDAFVLKKLSEKGLSMAAEADRRTLIRRVYADLIGLPPSPADTKAFLKDPSPIGWTWRAMPTPTGTKAIRSGPMPGGTGTT
jgi:Protein of unknown function (DUF1549)/Planctomycete cytochrome C